MALTEFQFVIDTEAMVSALAAALSNQRITLEEVKHEGQAVFEQDAVCGQQHQDG